MRKLLAIATILVFVFSITNVYACGDKSSAKASKASSGSSCASKAKAETADAGNGIVEASTANYKVESVDVSSHCSGKATAMKADGSGCAAKAKAMTADAKVGCTGKASAMKADAKSCCAAKGSSAKVMKADAKNCPATKDCPVPCNKDTKVNNMKAENMQKAPEISAKAISSEVSND